VQTARSKNRAWNTRWPTASTTVFGADVLNENGAESYEHDDNHSPSWMPTERKRSPISTR